MKLDFTHFKTVPSFGGPGEEGGKGPVGARGPPGKDRLLSHYNRMSNRKVSVMYGNIEFRQNLQKRTSSINLNSIAGQIYFGSTKII